jgi:hypothetical protein
VLFARVALLVIYYNVINENFQSRFRSYFILLLIIQVLVDNLDVDFEITLFSFFYTCMGGGGYVV